ncbi:hypothetical protein LBH_0976 [Lactobacillus helveticus H9]|nr:hypothetical protein LBH_0976 [Lactobacillus helveticus H9]
MSHRWGITENWCNSFLLTTMTLAEVKLLISLAKFWPV